MKLEFMFLAYRWLCLCTACVSGSWAMAAETSVVEFVAIHCSACHSKSDAAGGLDLEQLSHESLENAPLLWERVIRKIGSGQMPPEGEVRPPEAASGQFRQTIADALDRRYQEHPQLASTETLRRLNRTEYQNAIRDLLGLDVDASNLLPADESSHGFDNITVSDLTPTLLNRAITAAQKIAHLAVGAQRRAPSGETYRMRPDVTQEDHVPGLPIGTRGGMLFQHEFAQSGEYEFTVRLTRDRNEDVEGLNEPHELQVLIDRRLVGSFAVKPPPGRKDFTKVDAHLVARTQIAAGTRNVGITFVKKSTSLIETKRQPTNAHYNMHRHPRLTPAVYEVSITGPYADENASAVESGRAKQSAARRKLLGADGNQADLADGDQAIESGRKILGRVMHMAYRRPIAADDLTEPMEIFATALAQDGFDVALEQALAAVLVSPHFLFRVEVAPEGVTRGENYTLTDLQLATRLSFFLWSSLPDEELLTLAEQNRLREPGILESQVERMLADVKSQSLVDNFAEQWLYLRNLESMTPDLRLFPDFDDNLRQAFRQETKMLFEAVLREDRNVCDFLQSDFTYLNERLAKHYGIPHIYGSRFRRVNLEPGSHRGGLLRHGSILTVTSYATRTSPVIRGHWILKNITGSPPPPPPADVPALKDNTVAATLPMRARLAEHRQQAACAVCHNVMDPVGFSLENYDAIGRWRDSEDGQPIDASGGMAGFDPFVGIEGLERALVAQPELFVATMTEKLLTYAIGRPVSEHDGPAVRSVVNVAREHEYRFSSIIHGIVLSPPFQMRCAQ